MEVTNQFIIKTIETQRGNLYELSCFAKSDHQKLWLSQQDGKLVLSRVYGSRVRLKNYKACEKTINKICDNLIREGAGEVAVKVESVTKNLSLFD